MGQVLADAGYRSEAVIAELAQTQPHTELVIALGREGKVLAKPRDARRHPHTAGMAAKFEAQQRAKQDYQKRKWMAEPPNGWKLVHHGQGGERPPAAWQGPIRLKIIQFQIRENSRKSRSA